MSHQFLAGKRRLNRGKGMFVGMKDRIFDYINISLNILYLLNP